MRLDIVPSRLIKDLQKEFNDLFPFLKLEFFKNRNGSMPVYTMEEILPPNKKLEEGQAAISIGSIDITQEMKVKDLEKIFQEQFLLAVQVFRRSGNVWLETTMTDNWTLRQQNEHGREITNHNRVD